ncbi:hypothetical protein HYT04_02975 [Candidatus Kaiserbacteria bacterium]|nr:hypothetical protein [Candidatus Kaiserbacteria bacterium]
MSIILFLVAAFVMFSLAFILIARFVILLFLIIVAPIGFAGLAVPKLASLANKWWGELFKQTITAPVLLLLLYIALRVITDVNFLTGLGATKEGWTGTVANNISSFASVLISFLIAMGLLLAVVIISKSMSAFGGDMATKWAGRLSFGATAWAGRATVGTAIGRGLLGNRFIKRGAVSDNKFIKYGSRALSFTGKRLQNRTFDVRNMPGAKAGIGMLGVDIGTPSTLTAKQLQEKQYGAKPVKEFFRQSSLEHDKAAAELDRKQRLTNASAIYGPAATARQTADAEAARKEMKKMSTDELSALGDIRKGIDSLVWNLSPSAFADLMKSDKLSGSEKKDIKDSWDRQFSTSPVTASAMIDRLSTSETASLSGTNLTHANTMPLLDPSSLDAIRRKGDLTTAERHDIYVARSADPVFVAYLAADPSGARMSYWNV